MAIVKLTPDKMEQDAALVLKTATRLGRHRRHLH